MEQQWDGYLNLWSLNLILIFILILILIFILALLICILLLKNLKVFHVHHILQHHHDQFRKKFSTFEWDCELQLARNCVSSWWSRAEQSKAEEDREEARKQGSGKEASSKQERCPAKLYTFDCHLQVSWKAQHKTHSYLASEKRTHCHTKASLSGLTSSSHVRSVLYWEANKTCTHSGAREYESSQTTHWLTDLMPWQTNAQSLVHSLGRCV